GIVKPIKTPKLVYLVWVEEVIKSELNDELRETIISELFSSWLKKKNKLLNISTQLENDEEKYDSELLEQV
ncbi:MAG: peptidylprolyl isomerase, partial [Cyanobacteria bacterium J06629_18]